MPHPLNALPLVCMMKTDRGNRRLLSCRWLIQLPLTMAALHMALCKEVRFTGQKVCVWCVVGGWVATQKAKLTAVFCVRSGGGGSPCPRIPLCKGSWPRCPKGRRLRCGGWQHSSPGSLSPETENNVKGQEEKRMQRI